MKLSKERKTNIIGFLLGLILFLQIIGNWAAGKQQAAYQRINWLISHSAKTNAILANFANLFILDKENISPNLLNYQTSLKKAQAFHERATEEEENLFKSIKSWGQIESFSNLSCAILVIINMWLNLGLIKAVSK